MIHDALATASFSLLDGLLVRGADVNLKDLEGNTPLHWAVTGRSPHVQYLLNKGANTRIKNNYGTTPLGTATEEHNWAARDEIRAHTKGPPRPVKGKSDRSQQLAASNKLRKNTRRRGSARRRN
jgi:hypothetical protein